jgi:hypothetical protein
VGDKNVIQNFEYQLQLPCTPSVLIFCSSVDVSHRIKILIGLCVTQLYAYQTLTEGV